MQRFHRNIITFIGFLVASFLLPALSHAYTPIASNAEATHSASPYFQIENADSGIDSLPLKDTQVDVRIIGIIADVTVTQRYTNAGAIPLEARYIFPGSTRAAVYAMEVQVGGRLIRAAIREKQQARQDYEQAKSAGNTAALLEQARENVFQMNVANILPGDDVTVEMHYTEIMVPTQGEYAFVFPTVVGPRYANHTPANDTTPWQSTPYLPAGTPSPSQFSLRVNLVAPTAVENITSPSHTLVVRKNEHDFDIQLQTTSAPQNNRDFILNYRLSSASLASGAILSKGEKENFFLAMVQPPRQVDLQNIVPREYIFIVDISGSMIGFPLDTAKHLMKKLIGNLRDTDTFNVMLFAGSNSMLSPVSLPATQENLQRAMQTLENVSGGGGTELIPALKHGLSLPLDSNCARSFVVITDGYVTVEAEAFTLVRENLSKANLFAFGIGSAVNRALIEGLARAGQGEPFIVLNEEGAALQAERLARMIESPVLTHVSAHIEGIDAYEVEPLNVPDVFAERPIVLFGKWRGTAPGHLILSGQAATGPFHTDIELNPQDALKENQALRYLWARHRIASLTDQDVLEGGEHYKDAITDLGLQYNLLTQYTSFIAIDQQIRNAGETAITVDQALPLPQGVSNAAIGAFVPSTPEPGFWALFISMMSCMLGFFLWRRHAAAFTA